MYLNGTYKPQKHVLCEIHYSALYLHRCFDAQRRSRRELASREEQSRFFDEFDGSERWARDAAPSPFAIL